MGPIDLSTLATWREAVGRTETRRELLSADALLRFASAVGNDGPAPEDQPLAHWAFFLPSPQDSEIGPDGHPRRGQFLPEITFPRRMFAGSNIRFVSSLSIGKEATLKSTISNVAYKQGRSGELVFIEVERSITQGGIVRVHERQNFVYRGAAQAAALPKPLTRPPHGEIWLPGETNLFRFSAATFNAHRIHYDLPYTRDVEGYPALVVHGPFTAAKLAALASREGPLVQFEFRAMAPLFLGQPIYLRPEGHDAVVAVRCDGIVAMRAEFGRRRHAERS